MAKKQETDREHLRAWDDTYYVSAYIYAKQGLSNTQIAHAWGIKTATVSRWQAEDPAFDDALKRGRAGQVDNGGQTFAEYVYDRLPPELQETWDRMKELDEMPNGTRLVESLLEERGEKARQRLFFYALVNSHFNESEACKAVNITSWELKKWKNEDPDFASLANEIVWHKGNLFEGALVQAVENGEVPAIIHVAKTFNRDRGYGEKSSVDINMNGKVEHQVTHEVTLRLEDLNPYLTLDERMALCTAMKRREEDRMKLIPAEVTNAPPAG